MCFDVKREVMFREKSVIEKHGKYSVFLFVCENSVPLCDYILRKWRNKNKIRSGQLQVMGK